MSNPSIAYTNERRYDSIIRSNKREYQNTLNEENVDFAKAAGSLMANYWWDFKDKKGKPNTSKVSQALTTASKVPMNPYNVYFGVECWSQAGKDYRSYGIDGVTAMTDVVGESGTCSSGLGHGGTATGLAIKPLANRGFGFAIFSAHWAYPHFWRIGHKAEGEMYSRAVDRFMWEGTPDMEQNLPGLKCGCEAGVSKHIRSDFKYNPINSHAKRYPAGSEAFFHTDYNEPVVYLGKSLEKAATSRFRAHIGRQSVLPPPAERFVTLVNTTNHSTIGTMSALMKNDQPMANRSKCSINVGVKAVANSSDGSQLDGKLILHQLGADGKVDLDLVVSYQRLVELPELSMSVCQKVRLYNG